MSSTAIVCGLSDCDECQECLSFLAACKPVLDLPFHNGDEDWRNFLAAKKRVEEQNIKIELLLACHTHPDIPAFLQSPLYEALFAAPPVIPPATKFTQSASAAGSHRSRTWVGFTPTTFIRLCADIDAEWNVTKKLTAWRHKLLFDMAKNLHGRQVNVIDFLSRELTDEKLQEIPFLQLVINTLAATKSHVVIDLVSLGKWASSLNYTQGYTHAGSRMAIPPYPSNGLLFDQQGLLQSIHDAEADTDEFSFTNCDGIASISILHKRLHYLRQRDIRFSQFMVGRKPAEGAPGATMFGYIEDSMLDDDGHIDCLFFFASLASQGSAQAYLDAIYRDPPERQLMSRDEATAWVDTLQKADVTTIPRDAMRCCHCWSDFDEVVEGLNNEPVHLPCDSRHMLGRDCLIEVLVKMGPLCIICRQDMVQAAARAAQSSS